MTVPRKDDSFFIGWAVLPKPMRGFLAAVVVVLLALAGVASYLVAATQNDPGDGAFRGQARATGVLQARPYPILHVTESKRFPPGTALILSGGGKTGVAGRAEALDGKLVQMQGVWLSRGDLNGLQLGNLKPLEGAAPDVPTVSLGRWRLTGEICDGKCLNGAMRPGRGLAHKACANLCLVGGVPPVFVATDKVEGSEFFLLGDADGAPLGDALLDHTAVLVEAEGEIERRGTLLVFLLDPDTIRLAR